MPEAQERVLTAEEDRKQILKRAREYEATAKDEREKVMELRRKLSQNYEHLERCTRDNARLSDELLETSREAETARWAAIMAQGQSFNMRNQILQQGISPPVSPVMHGTCPASVKGLSSWCLPKIISWGAVSGFE